MISRTDVAGFLANLRELKVRGQLLVDGVPAELATYDVRLVPALRAVVAGYAAMIELLEAHLSGLPRR